MSANPRLTKDEFLAWRAHPVTEVVHRYLLDYAASIRADWAQGANWTDGAKQQVFNFEDLAEIDLESIETFYEAKDADEQSNEHEGQGSAGY